MTSANDIKALLLEIMEEMFQPADVTATQQMGVQLSNAVKREGVVIIQNQNVEVYARIMPSMVKALRLCDALEPAMTIVHEPLQITAEPASDPIEEACAFMFNEGARWEEMQALMRIRYIEYVVGQFKTKREAAEMLGIGSTYLSKMTKPTETIEGGSQ
jgi:hypothetical protein